MAMDLPFARDHYRMSCLAISQVAGEPLSRSPQILLDELARLNPLFPPLIADRPPLTASELDEVRTFVGKHFTADPHDSRWSDRIWQGRGRSRRLTRHPKCGSGVWSADCTECGGTSGEDLRDSCRGIVRFAQRTGSGR